MFADDATWVVPGERLDGRDVRGARGDLRLPRPAAEGDGRHLLVLADRRARLGRPSRRVVPRERRAQRAAGSSSTRCCCSGSRTGSCSRCSRCRATRPRSRRSGPDDAELDFTRFDAITFDCYGTLIDWEQGILNALQPVLAPHGVDASEDELLERYARHEAALEAGDVSALPRDPGGARCAGSARSSASTLPTRMPAGSRSAIGEWPAFHDTAPALRRLHERFRLGVITNCDRDLFALSNRRLGVTFDWIVAAEDARAYKPSLGTVRARLRDDRRAARAHPPHRPEPLPRPRPGQAARPDDGVGRPAPRPGGLRRHATSVGDARI